MYVAPVVATPLIQAQATQKPKVIGSPRVSEVLSVNRTKWTGYPAPQLTYKWYSCTTEIAAASEKVPKSCKVIQGETKRKLKLTANQSGKYISVMVMGSSAGTPKTKLMSRSSDRVS
jgi:hypothetical protein